jgi:hypothetical protein
MIANVIETTDFESVKNVDSYHKTSLDFILNRSYLENQTEQTNFLRDIVIRYVFKYYGKWLFYSRPLDAAALDMDLSLFLFQKNDKKIDAQGIFPFIEKGEFCYFLEEFTGTADLRRKKNEILSRKYKTPFGKDALSTYRYFFSDEKVIDGIPSYEIAFFSRKHKENAFEGYIYLSKKDSSFVKAIFTLNYLNKSNLINDILFTRSLKGNEDCFYIGNDSKAGVMLKRNTIPDSANIPPLTLSQLALPELIVTAENTRVYDNMQRLGIFALNQKIGLFRNKIEIGSLAHAFSINDMEGARLRFGANTTELLTRRLRLGGYLAYGLRDNNFKYRTDVGLSFSRKDRLNFTFVQDLNIPGRDLLEDDRDLIYKSIKSSGGNLMTLQKIALTSFEKSFFDCFSIGLSAKYLYDYPEGVMHYPSVNTFETGILLRFAPNEKYIRFRDSKFVFRKPDLDIQIGQRFGIKGFFGSEYRYRITSFSAYKKFFLPVNIGTFDIRLSGGKVWDTTPFPLLFIPKSDQSSFFYESNEYNMLNLYEGITDRFLASNTNFFFNWTPINFFYTKSKIQTTLGLKTLYGPLSDNNNPEIHAELFPFQGIVEPMGDKPYFEGNIGLSNILHLFRIDYIHRFGTCHRGAVLYSLSFAL